MAEPLRTVLVDDVALARHRLRRLLSAHADVLIVGEADSGPDAVQSLHALRPDLVFLDIQMPELDGFGVLAEGIDPRPAIVFVTAYDHYAARAFAIEAVDYLLKPPTPERLAQCLNRVRALRRSTPAAAGTTTAVQRIAIRERGGRRWLPVSAIAWVESAGNYLVLHSDDGRHVIRETLTMLARRLDPARFCRVGRSRLVALDRIRALEPQNSGDQIAVLACGARIPVSRAFRAALVGRLAGQR
jgi:two-component system LytT family response regulator